jgi:GNAT superfamily N-acetyltransferase
MGSQFTIRLATANDVNVIADHRARMFHEMGDIPTNAISELRNRSQDRLRDLILKGEYVGWLAMPANDSNTIAGGAGIQLRQVLPHPLSRGNRWIGIADGRHATVLNVFTEPTWRRQGIAVLLLREIIHWTQSQQLDRVVLHASNAGRELYEGLGFVPTNEMRLTGEKSVHCE